MTRLKCLRWRRRFDKRCLREALHRSCREVSHSTFEKLDLRSLPFFVDGEVPLLWFSWFDFSSSCRLGKPWPCRYIEFLRSSSELLYYLYLLKAHILRPLNSHLCSFITPKSFDGAFRTCVDVSIGLLFRRPPWRLIGGCVGLISKHPTLCVTIEQRRVIFKYRHATRT